MTFDDFTLTPEASAPHYLIIGDPVSHSLSPVMHRHALRSLSLPGDYHAVRLPADRLSAFRAWLDNPSFLGCSVTVPHKVALTQLVDALDPEVEACGALNTLYRRDGLWRGSNTDILGILRALEAHRDRLEGRGAVVFGTGGASRGALHALRQMRVGPVHLVSRTPSAVDPALATACSYADWPEFASDAGLLINATPLGMTPRTEGCPLTPDQVHLMADKVCFDMVYRPLRTRFLQMAEKAGAQAVSGLRMLTGQAAGAFELWTGREFPEQEVHAQLHSLLEREQLQQNETGS